MSFEDTVPEVVEDIIEEVVPEAVQEAVLEVAEEEVQGSVEVTEVQESPIEQLYDAREIGGIILREVETQYNQVPIPHFININLQFDTSLLEFTDSREEESGYGTQPEEAGYESEGSDGSEPWTSAAPAV